MQVFGEKSLENYSKITPHSQINPKPFVQYLTEMKYYVFPSFIAVIEQDFRNSSEISTRFDSFRENYQRSRIQLCLALLEALNKYVGVSIRALRFIPIRNSFKTSEGRFGFVGKQKRARSLNENFTDWLYKNALFEF